MEERDWLDDESCLTRDECIEEVLALAREGCTYCRLAAEADSDE